MSCCVFPLPCLEPLHSPPTRAPTTPHRQPLPWRQMTNAASPTALTETTCSASYSVPRMGDGCPIWKDFGGVWKGIENEGIHPGPSLRTSPPKTGWKMASG